MLINNKKVLVLYASYGDGHIQVSRVMKEKLSDRGFNVKMIDLFAESHPYINQLVRYTYLKSYTIAPSLYGLSYYITQDMNNNNVTSRWFNAFGIKKMQEIIEKEDPLFVINTFPMLVMPELKRRTKWNIPIFTIITDFVLHKRWLHSEVNKYYVATEELKNELIKAGIPRYKVCDSGIPIRDPFESNMLKYNINPIHSFDKQVKTVLIIAGAYGVLSHMKELCSKFVETTYNIIVICGKNKQLKSRLKKDFAEYDNILITGFIEHIHEVMASSSCIITKPGGITLSESLRVQKPIFLYRPAPGQEKENALYLEKKGIATIAYNIDKLVSNIFQLLEDPALYMKILENIQLQQKPHAADVVLRDMLSEIEKYKDEQGLRHYRDNRG